MTSIYQVYTASLTNESLLLHGLTREHINVAYRA